MSRSKWCEMDSEGEWQCSLDSEEDGSAYSGLGRRRSSLLPWDYKAIERIVLLLADKFGFRLEMSASLVRSAGTSLLVPAGLAIAGGALGRHVGGRTGAAIGGALGGAIGVGVLAVTLRDVWDSIKGMMPELFELVFDYLAGLGMEDYQTAIQALTSMDSVHAAQLAAIVVNVIRQVVGANVLSSLPAA